MEGQEKKIFLKTYRAQTNLKRGTGSPAALVFLSSPEECDCVGGKKNTIHSKFLPLPRECLTFTDNLVGGLLRWTEEERRACLMASMM